MQSCRTLDDFLPGFRPQAIRPRDKRGRKGTGWMVKMAFGGRAVGAHNVACAALGAGGTTGQKGLAVRTPGLEPTILLKLHFSGSDAISGARPPIT